MNFIPSVREQYPFEARKVILDAIADDSNDFEALQDIIDPIELVYPGIQSFVLNNSLLGKQK